MRRLLADITAAQTDLLHCHIGTDSVYGGGGVVFHHIVSSSHTSIQNKILARNAKINKTNDNTTCLCHELCTFATSSTF